MSMSKKFILGADGRLYQVLAAGVVLASIVTATDASAAVPKKQLPDLTMQDDEASSTLSTVPY